MSFNFPQPHFIEKGEERPDTISAESDRIKISVNPQKGGQLEEIAFAVDGGWIRLTPKSSPAFLMVPYCNRIKDGRFSFEGRSYQLSRPETHTLHGDGRDVPWRVIEHSDNKIAVEFVSHPRRNEAQGFFENFPFPYRAVATYEVRDNEVLHSVDIHNIGSDNLPTGCGIHPYYLRGLVEGETVELQFKVKGEYPWSPPVPLPEGPLEISPPHSNFLSLKPIVRGLDHCYGGWDGKATLYWPKSKIVGRVTGTPNQRHIVVYTPAEDTDEELFFCFEAVTNMNDAFNFLGKEEYDTGAVILKPGEALKTTYTIAFEAGVERESL